MSQRLVQGSGEAWESDRQWYGVNGRPIASESVSWSGGLVEVKTASENLKEYGEALRRRRGTPSGSTSIETFLSNSTTHHSRRSRTLTVPHEPVTLSSLPLFVARHWTALRNGETLRASYLVLKVQRAATVKVRRASDHVSDGRVLIEVSPTNVLLRALFGTTTLCFENAVSPKLLLLRGLLDPRDLKPNGRWHEYLGTMEFDQPWDLTPLVAPERCDR